MEYCSHHPSLLWEAVLHVGQKQSDRLSADTPLKMEATNPAVEPSPPGSQLTSVSLTPLTLRCALCGSPKDSRPVHIWTLPEDV